MEIKTWHVEALVVAVVLATTVYTTDNSVTAWVGAVAVFVMTRRISVADRMREAEAAAPVAATECYRWYGRYLFIGEWLWAVYFVMLGAWPALVGVGLMVGYPIWRSVYRRWRPRGRVATSR